MIFSAFELFEFTLPAPFLGGSFITATGAYARRRRWSNLRLLSAGDSTFKYDLGSEDREGSQDSTVSVFTRDGDGKVRLFYTGHPKMAPDIDERGIDLLCAVYNFLDLTPKGRGSWYASLDDSPGLKAAGASR